MGISITMQAFSENNTVSQSTKVGGEYLVKKVVDAELAAGPCGYLVLFWSKT